MLNAHRAMERLDPNILAALPRGTMIKEILPSGESVWTQTYKLRTSLQAQEISYFLKLTPYERMPEGEYKSMLAIHKIAPGFCPRPIGHGTLSSGKEYFYLCEFLPIIQEMCIPSEPSEFCAQLAELHKRGTSPNGKFGFGVPTFNGCLEQKNDWQDSWEENFTVAFQYLLDREKEVNGPSQELAELIPPLFDLVIPGLLRPLMGRIKPCLVHGDLWIGNMAEIESPNVQGKLKTVVFDASSLYAHNEYDMGHWTAPRHKSQSLIEEYKKYFPPTEPAEDFGNRLKLYGMRFNLHSAILFPGKSHADELDFRQMVIEDMRDLVREFKNRKIT